MANTTNNMKNAKLIKRSNRVSFMKCTIEDKDEYVRMQGFTSLTESKSPKEYTRQYVDEDVERSDVAGYATQKPYSFDRHSPFAPHQRLAEIADNELTGSEAQVEIVTVDLFTDGTAKEARQRMFSVIPDTSDDGTDALVYSGNFRAAGEIVKGTATSTDGWQTCTFVPNETEPEDPEE